MRFNLGSTTILAEIGKVEIDYVAFGLWIDYNHIGNPEKKKEN